MALNHQMPFFAKVVLDAAQMQSCFMLKAIKKRLYPPGTAAAAQLLKTFQ
jgi:hypothetical protein